jgi:uncharacterized protein (DUF2236 family)
MPQITNEQFEAALIEARANIANPAEGIFGPGSLMWQVGREGILFLGAGCAALMQTAHPFVAAAIDQHSDVHTDPMARFRRTFINVFDMVFGSEEEAVAAARKVRSVHNHINGTLGDGTAYSAHDQDAVRWVHISLWDTALRVHDMFQPELSGQDKERYWTEALRFAALFGLTADVMPRTFQDFEIYMAQTVSGDLLSVSDEARDIADHLLMGKGGIAALPKWYVAVTAGLMPPRVRDAYGLTFGPLDRRRAEKAIRRLQRLYPLLPEKLRYAPGFHKAQARLEGKAAPDLITRSLEKVILGKWA